MLSTNEASNSQASVGAAADLHPFPGRRRASLDDSPVDVSQLSNATHGHRRASLDDSPVDVSQMSQSGLKPEIRAKIYCPKTRRSSLPAPPFNDD